jgi:hypothetical protein
MNPKIEKQINNGVRLGLGIAGLLVGAGLFAVGLGRILGGTIPPHHIVWLDPLGWFEVMAGAAILIASANVWWQLLAGCMALGFFKCIGILITGSGPQAPFRPFPRPLALEVMFIAAATLALMWRFNKGHMTILDRVALTLYVFSFALWYRTSDSEFSRAAVSSGVGLAVLAIAWCVHRWAPHKKRSANQYISTTQSTLP